MITVGICDGLGNQLFQYAAARHLALLHGTELVLDLSHYIPPYNTALPYRLDRFSIQAETFELGKWQARYQRLFQPLRHLWAKAVPLWVVQEDWEQNLDFFIRRIDTQYSESFHQLPDHVHLIGSWQSELYFKPSSAVIRKDLEVPEPGAIAAEVAGLRERRDVVAVHVRRGDALKNPYLAVMAESYFHAAMERFGTQYNFLFFSDDLEWCQARFKADNIDFSVGRSGFEDFYLQSACTHHIISNSTYSWWAAWLAEHPDQQVIAPLQWNKPGIEPWKYEDIVPARWIGLENPQ